MPATSLHALLAHSIDYAGMFPPCSLGLEPALRNQAEYVRSPDAWMLAIAVGVLVRRTRGNQSDIIGLVRKCTGSHPPNRQSFSGKTALDNQGLGARLVSVFQQPILIGTLRV
jgi:hypothetical protein